mmetsp:Transcript_15304/g.44447  ORF Transcript_15304/g.44447 Transcript_15304/m.44447 type:complete len:206 (+) Transcript_15304:1992-2609(+)
MSFLTGHQTNGTIIRAALQHIIYCLIHIDTGPIIQHIRYCTCAVKEPHVPLAPRVGTLKTAIAVLQLFQALYHSFSLESFQVISKSRQSTERGIRHRNVPTVILCTLRFPLMLIGFVIRTRSAIAAHIASREMRSPKKSSSLESSPNTRFIISRSVEGVYPLNDGVSIDYFVAAAVVQGTKQIETLDSEVYQCQSISVQSSVCPR